ncbi:MAG: FAD-dependent oxidoreductase [Bacillota bacterium]|nr:FAD-dependent oxidoreductase [Bacillota bacterium]
MTASTRANLAVVIVGGGWAGCAAAVSAARALRGRGRAVVLERTDMLLGLGLAGGIFRNNGRYTAAEECLALGGGGRLIGVMDGAARHTGIEFPGHRHASLYDTNAIEPDTRAFLAAEGVEVRLMARVTGAGRAGRRVTRVEAGGEAIMAQAFVDATGSAGPPGNCLHYGNGCAMCVLRCPSFGPRLGLAELAGHDELVATRADGTPGSFSGSCDLRKDSLDPWLREQLERTGVAQVPIPEDLRQPGKLDAKACQQYNLPEFGSSLVLLDSGTAKMMSPYFPLEGLRRLPGLSRARYDDPAAGGIGNSVRFMAIARHDRCLRVTGLANVFCAGEKCGPQVGHTEAIVTGMIAGHNAARSALGLEPVALPSDLAVGDFVGVLTSIVRKGRLATRLTFAGAAFFERMRMRKAYTTDGQAIRDRIAGLGLDGIFDQPLS